MAIEKIKLDKMTDFIDKINNNFNQLSSIIISSNSPSKKTKAQIIGQKFLNTSTMDIYVCSSITYDESGIENDNTIYEWNLISGKNKYPIIMGNGEPINTTYAVGIGQLYIDQNTNNLYICVNIEDDNSSYDWYLIAKGNVYPIIVSIDGIIGRNIAKGIGQLLMDFTNENLYICVGKEDNDDIWCPVNTDDQQILYSSFPPSVKNNTKIWFKKIYTI